MITYADTLILLSNFNVIKFIIEGKKIIIQCGSITICLLPLFLIINYILHKYLIYNSILMNNNLLINHA